MSNGVSLSHLQDVRYEQIRGAYIVVEVGRTGPKLTNPERWTETREGKIVGRGNGVGVYYDGEAGEVLTHSIGPAVYIETPEDTVLEVRTDKSENRLIEYQPPDADT